MKTFSTFVLTGFAALTLAACGSTGLGDFDNEPPYQQGRTATHETTMPAPAPAPEPVVVKEAPMCKPCEDCSPLQTRIQALEAELAACREARTRVNQAFTEELRK